MFGSLVIVLPTPHQGGELILRDKGKEWSFPSPPMPAKDSPDHLPQISYIAFYSDVEHEVAKVETGYRVTLTYNLYFNFPTIDMEHKPLICRDNNVKTLLESLLSSLSFLPDGGELAFGLQREYPVDKKKTKLDYLLSCLKGTDATLLRVCKELGLDFQFNLVYTKGNTAVLATLLVKVEGLHFDEDMSPMTYILKKSKGRLMDDHDSCDDDENVLWSEPKKNEVCWVTKITDLGRFKSSYTAYGNEHRIGYVYTRGCLVTKVKPFGR